MGSGLTKRRLKAAPLTIIAPATDKEAIAGPVSGVNETGRLNLHHAQNGR